MSINQQYGNFLKSKKIVDVPSGFEPKELNKHLYNFQRDICAWAIRRGRAGIFADCGLGKTAMQLEWARQVYEHTGKNILILAPLAVSHQTQREAKKFDMPDIAICRSQNDVKPGTNITNYEMLHQFDPDEFIGVVLDESSILKSYTGKFRNKIINDFQKTPYKLACTATPAPNDFIELGNHSEFLNVLTRAEMLSMFFINDASHIGTWRLKGHAQKEFWNWICSWAVMIKHPSDLAYEDDGFRLPELNLRHVEVKHGKPLSGNLFMEEARTMDERRAARRESIDIRAERLAEIVTANNGQPWLIWCNLNKEADAITKMIPGAVNVQGSDRSEIKEKNLLAFSNGEIQTLVTKPKIGGFGMNWQHCSNVAFLGLSDSYESFYQAVRRCWRFGQKNPVNAYVVTADIEGAVVENIKRKEVDSQRLHREMVDNMSDITKQALNEKATEKSEYKKGKSAGKNWTLYLGDSVEMAKKIPDDSIGYSIFSPPFASLFTYTDSERDMGNTRNEDEFFNHFDFLISELYRLMIPGRLVTIHCMNLPMTITNHGAIGMRDFRGEIIRAVQRHDFIYHSEVCIWKDPLVQAVRTKALALAHKQICTDSTRCGQGFPDYLVTMRKPGTNPDPVNHGRGFECYIGERPEPTKEKLDDPRRNKYSHEVWQRYASPVWFDIRQTRTLNERQAREDRDERHMCPLQLDVIERCLHLWTNPDDMVFSPFAGIGSELFCAIKMGRKAVGIELKESYYREAINNLKGIENERQQDIFSNPI